MRSVGTLVFYHLPVYLKTSGVGASGVFHLGIENILTMTYNILNRRAGRELRLPRPGERKLS